MVSIRERGRRNRPQNQNSSSSRRREPRYRHPKIESFSANTEANIDHACYDRMSITVPAYRLFFPDINAYRRFRGHLISTGLIIRDQGGFTPRFQNNLLFSGNLNLQYSAIEIEDKDEYQLIVKYELKLNPSRFIHHAFIKCGEETNAFTLEALEQRERRELLTKEDMNSQRHSLDLNDNFIPNEIFKTARPFDDFLEFYIRSVIELLNDEIFGCYEASLEHEASEGSDYEFSHEGWNIKACEVYWEYGVNDARSFINGMWDQFQAVLYDTTRKKYLATETGQRRTHNGVAIYANDLGTRGLRLSAYAKLGNRIRFELRYNQTLRRLLAYQRTSNISSSIDGIFELLQIFKENTHRRLRRMLRALPDLARTERAEYHVFADFLVLLADLHRDYPNVGLRNTLSTLINNGRYVVQPDSPRHEIMERLREDYIVETPEAYIRNDNDEIIYTLTPRYRNVIEAFRDVFEEMGENSSN
jgi:hypothetical protein